MACFLPTFRCQRRSPTRILEPIDIVATFGDKPDLAEVDAHVRSVMQDALDDMALKRRFPIARVKILSVPESSGDLLHLLGTGGAHG